MNSSGGSFHWDRGSYAVNGEPGSREVQAWHGHGRYRHAGGELLAVQMEFEFAVIGGPHHTPPPDVSTASLTAT